MDGVSVFFIILQAETAAAPYGMAQEKLKDMSSYAIYSYTLHKGGPTLSGADRAKDTIKKANKIFSRLLGDPGLKVAKTNGKLLPCLNQTGRDNVFVFEVCNEKNVTYYTGHDKDWVESHPGNHVVIDNRPNVCQIAIERNPAFNNRPDTVARYLRHTFNTLLEESGLAMDVKRKFQAGKFMDIVREKIRAGHAVSKVVWLFPNPNNVKGIDASRAAKNRLTDIVAFTATSNAMYGRFALLAKDGIPINIEEMTPEIAQVIALSAQNGYDVSFHFNDKSTMSARGMIRHGDPVCALFDIGDEAIYNFRHGQTAIGTDGRTTYELVGRLDEIRDEIKDYEHEKVIDDD